MEKLLKHMEDSYDGDAFRRVFKSLKARTRQAMKDKADWEHMSVSAVMREWWPKHWEKVVGRAR